MEEETNFHLRFYLFLRALRKKDGREKDRKSEVRLENLGERTNENWTYCEKDRNVRKRTEKDRNVRKGTEKDRNGRKSTEKDKKDMRRSKTKEGTSSGWRSEVETRQR